MLLRRGVADLTLLGRPDDDRPARPRAGPGHRAARRWSTRPPVDVARRVRRRRTPKLRAHQGVTAGPGPRHGRATSNYFGTLMVQTGHADGDGLRRDPPHRRHHPPRVRDHQDACPGVSVASSVFFMLPRRPGAGLRRLRGQPRPGRRPARRHRHLLGRHRRPVRHRAAGRDAVLLDRQLRARAPTWRRSPRPPRWSASAGPTCRSRARSSTTRRSTRPWPRPSCPAATVAGRATVFIFPDLNTGNNTYKAVQRSAGAVAVGPVHAGPAPAGQRPVPGRDRAGHRQHRGDHRHPGPAPVVSVPRTSPGAGAQLRLVVGEVPALRRRPASSPRALVERIGEPGGGPADHEAALRRASWTGWT